MYSWGQMLVMEAERKMAAGKHKEAASTLCTALEYCRGSLPVITTYAQIQALASKSDTA